MMREYSKLFSRFWTGRTGRQIRRLGPECQLVALYLISAPTANALGLYYLPYSVIVHETGLPLETAIKAVRMLVDAGFCAYDELSETVFITNMARFQIGKTLKVADKRVIWIRRELERAAASPFFAQFLEIYGKDYQLAELGFAKPPASPLEGPSMALRSIETEIETESEIEMKIESEHSDGGGGMRGNRINPPSAMDDQGSVDDITQRTQERLMKKRAGLR